MTNLQTATATEQDRHSEVDIHHLHIEVTETSGTTNSIEMEAEIGEIIGPITAGAATAEMVQTVSTPDHAVTSVETVKTTDGTAQTAVTEEIAVIGVIAVTDVIAGIAMTGVRSHESPGMADHSGDLHQLHPSVKSHFKMKAANIAKARRMIGEDASNSKRKLHLSIFKRGPDCMCQTLCIPCN